MQAAAAASIWQADLHRCKPLRGFLQECKKKAAPKGRRFAI
jgi:hypothetical protein